MSIRDRLKPTAAPGDVTAATPDMLDERAPARAATPNSPAGVGTELADTPGERGQPGNAPATPTPAPRAPAQPSVPSDYPGSPFVPAQPEAPRGVLGTTPYQAAQGAQSTDDLPMTQGQWRQMMDLMSQMGKRVDAIPVPLAPSMPPGTVNMPHQKPVPQVGQEAEIASVREGRLSTYTIRVDHVEGELISGDVLAAGDNGTTNVGRFANVARYRFDDPSPNRVGWS